MVSSIVQLIVMKPFAENHEKKLKHANERGTYQQLSLHESKKIELESVYTSVITRYRKA